MWGNYNNTYNYIGYYILLYSILLIINLHAQIKPMQYNYFNNNKPSSYNTYNYIIIIMNKALLKWIIGTGNCNKSLLIKLHTTK